MLASTLMLIALLCAGVFITVPYSEMSPGPTVNTLGDHGGEPVLQISGRKTYATTGHLNMTTVRVTSADYRMNLIEAVYGWLSHDNKVVPHDTLYPDGKTEEQSTQENAEEFSQSQESAKVAALKELDVPVQSWVIVSTVKKGSPAEGALHAGDVIKAVDGTPVKEPDDVAEAGDQAQDRREGRLHHRARRGTGRRREGEPGGHQEAGRHHHDRRGPTTTEPSAPSSGSPPGPTTPSRSPSTSSSPTSEGPARDSCSPSASTTS